MSRAQYFLDHDGPIAFAHRGGAGVYSENTWAAFDHAAALGYRYIETDVRRTSDGVVLAFHDATLDRVADRSGTIARMSWEEVRRARIGGDQAPVRLDELLAAYPTMRFNIDPKEDAVVGPLADVLRRGAAVDRVCIASFRASRIAKVRKLLDDAVCFAGGPLDIARLRVAAGRGGVRPRSVPCVQVPVRMGRVTVLDERFVAAAHRVGTKVHVWTIDDPAEMARLLDLGVDGIMTDKPDELRSLLIKRGQWTAGV